MRYLGIFLISSAILLMAGNTYAENLAFLQINGDQAVAIYQEPNRQSQGLTHLYSGQIIVPLLEQSGWLKVANPKNGEVGWIQQTDLTKTTKILMVVTKPNARQYVITITNPYKNNHSHYSVIQYTDTPVSDQKQITEWLKQIDTEQKIFDRHFDTLFQNFTGSFQPLTHFPIIQPIIIIQDGSDKKPVKTEEKSWWQKLVHSKNE